MFIIVGLAALAPSACRTKPSTLPRVSPQMTDLLRTHRGPDGGFSTSGLQELPAAPALTGQRAVEILTVPPTAGSTNKSTYQIFFDHISGQYWIQRLGEEGDSKVFGPPAPAK